MNYSAAWSVTSGGFEFLDPCSEGINHASYRWYEHIIYFTILSGFSAFSVCYISQKTSVLCAPERKVLATRAPAFTVSSLNSCARYSEGKEMCPVFRFVSESTWANWCMCDCFCLGWRFYQPQRNRRQIHLWGEVCWWELPVEALGHGHALHGERRAQHQRVPVLHLHGFNWLVSSTSYSHSTKFNQQFRLVSDVPLTY